MIIDLFQPTHKEPYVTLGSQKFHYFYYLPDWSRKLKVRSSKLIFYIPTMFYSFDSFIS